MKNTWSRSIAAFAVAGLCAAGASACSPSKGSPSPSASVVQGGQSVGVETVKVSGKGVKDIPALNGQESVLADFQQSKCEGGPGKVVAAGTVVNRADKPRDIVATASWKEPSSTKPVTQLSAVLKQVPSGGTMGFEISSDVPGGKDDVFLCGLRVDAGTLK